MAKNLPAIQLKQLFDVEAVSILKGPQGSGAGRNASAGAIKVYTRKPTGEFGGFLRFDYGNFNSIDVEGAVEAPIVPDVLAARAAFSLKRRDGLVTNRCAGLTDSTTSSPRSGQSSSGSSNRSPRRPMLSAGEISAAIR